MSNFETEPRDYALELIENGMVSADRLLICCLGYMSHDDVRDMLDCNELSPRFSDDEPEEYELEDEEDVRNEFWIDHPEYLDQYHVLKTQNDYSVDIRSCFVDWLDQCHKNGRLSTELAQDVTL